MADGRPAADQRSALVLGGGGAWGIVQAAYVYAALEAGFRPDLVVGTSVGSLNGAWVALHPDDPEGLLHVWLGLDRLKLLRLNPLHVVRRLVRHPVSICRNEIVPELIKAHIGGLRFEDTALPFAVVATSLSRSAKHVFRSGRIGDAILASTAIPGVFEPVELQGELFIDGGISASVDLATAAEMGATEILAVDLTPAVSLNRPRTAIGVLRQAFGIAAHASTDAMEACLREQVCVRVLRPDLSRNSAWRIDDSAGAIAHNLRLARQDIARNVDMYGHLRPEPIAAAATEVQPVLPPTPRRFFGLRRPEPHVSERPA